MKTGKKTATRLGSVACSALLATGGLGGGSAFADTLAWLRFEDLPVNGAVRASVSLANAAGGSLVGKTDSIGNDATDWSQGDWTVGGTNDWPATVSLLAGAETLPNGRAVFFTEGKNDVGVVRVDDEQDGAGAWRLANGSFTVEIFVKTTSANAQTLVCRGAARDFRDWGTNDFWRLELAATKTGDAARRLRLYSKGGEAAVRMSESWRNTPPLNDGKWHHVAATYDAAKRVWQTFVDYQTVETLALTEAEVPDLAGRPVIIGCEPQRTWAKFRDGLLDEFRISDRVLGPGEFLGYRAVAHEVTDDVAVYLPFDDPAAVGAEAFAYAGGWTAERASPLAWNAVHPARVAGLALAGGATGVLQRGDLPSTELHATVRRPGRTDGGALTAGKSGVVVSNLSEALAASYTVETFFKLETGYTDAATEVPLLTMPDRLYLQVPPSGSLAFAYGKFSGSVRPSDRVVDGRWHHLACAYDHAARRVDFYLDHRLVGTGADIDLSAPDVLYLGSSQWSAKFNKVQFDALRVTKRALGPGEFLSPDGLSGATLLYAGLDRSLDVSPALACVGAGALADFHSVSPTFRGLSARPVMTVGGATFKEANVAALDFAGGGKAVFTNPLPGVPTSTVEFYVRPSAASPSARLVAFCPDGEETPLWALGFAADGETLCLVVGETTIPTGVRLAGGVWRHVTLVLSTPETGDSAARLAVGSSGAATCSLGMRLSDRLSGLRDPKVILGGGAGGGLNARIDELRITEGVVPAEDLLLWRPSGFALLVR